VVVPFVDRVDAGQRLAKRLEHLRDHRVVVLGLPRGGVPVAAEVARALDAPLDVIVVRKLGLPAQPELAMGALGEDGVRVLNDDVLRSVHVSAEDLETVERRERAELERRARRFRGGRPRRSVEGRTVVIVDDGIATGSTARAACQVARAHGALGVVLAVPVAPPDSVVELSPDADHVVCLETPMSLWAIGQWYEDFSQTSDDEVVRLLEAADARARPPA
jgi:putative phosphoribosyl transferase